ncbi:hypothetical protein AEAC466_00320 [Asticcacaulis sp. AC466]|uniref:phosphatase PAP2 family protein n=1 Tax=Asticcacaulis sp. AC466 TaxID=1282362 RepID=UPI0003C3FAFE|nr:phosphatase PAP2 family protein [Asticcacaulis sp. AC466]ESQ85651.1 hypothetical protein AEAC466_00320 [Asticcacaulis sp. AC466]
MNWRSRIDRLPLPLRQEWRALLLFGAILVTSAWLFFEIIEEVFLEDPLFGPDNLTYAALQALRNPMLDRLMIGITELGDTWVVVAVTAAGAVWLMYKRAWHTLIYWLMAVGGGSLINSAIKLGLQRARPGDLNYGGVSVFSFPSGHSTTNAVLYGMLIMIMARELPFRSRIPIVTGLVSLVGIIAFSRLYLGAHWLSDVAGGLFFGSMWLALLGLFYMWRPAEPVEPIKMMAVIGLALAFGGGVNMACNFGTDHARYTARSVHALPPNGSPT